MQHSATVIALFSGPADWCIFTRTHHQLFVWSLWSAEPITLGTHCVLFSLVPWHLSLAVLMPPPPWSENTNQAHGKRLLVLLLLGRRKPFFSIYILIEAVEVSKCVELPFVWKNQQRNAASSPLPLITSPASTFGWKKRPEASFQLFPHLQFLERVIFKMLHCWPIIMRNIRLNIGRTILLFFFFNFLPVRWLRQFHPLLTLARALNEKRDICDQKHFWKM